MTTSAQTSSTESNDQAASLYLLTTMVLFGSAFASSKVVVNELPHQIAAVLRFGGGAIVLAVMLAIAGRRAAAVSRKAAVRAALVGLIGVFGYNLFFFWGLSLAPSLDGAIIVPVMSPVLTTSYLVLTGKERASAARTAGLTVAVIGAITFFVSVGGTDSGLTGSRLAGDAVFLLGAVCWATYTIISKRVLVGVDPLRATTFGTTAGAFALTLAALPALGDARWSEVSTVGWLNIVYLAIGPTALAYVCYYRGLRSVAPSTATIMMFTVPVFGTICATVFLGESFSSGQIAGSVIMIVGALVAVTQANCISSLKRAQKFPLFNPR